jgi:hypothetical protein
MLYFKNSHRSKQVVVDMGSCTNVLESAGSSSLIIQLGLSVVGYVLCVWTASDQLHVLTILSM